MTSLFSSNRANDAVMYGEFMGFVLDDASVMSLRGWAERQGYPQAAVQQGGPDIFAQMLESSPPPKMAIVDIDQQSDPAAITTRLNQLCGGECRLVIVGSKNDVGLYRTIINAGAIDYLVKPFSPDVLNQALAEALRAPVGAKQPEARESRIVVFLGARGGIGTSTLALNTAWILAHELNQNVALLDLDLQFGTSSLTLDLNPGHGLRDIVSSPNRVDALMIASSIVPESERLSILGAEEAVDELTPIDGSAIDALLKEMRTNFEVIVVDLPRYMFATQKRLLASAHEIVIASDLSLVGVRDTLRLKSALVSLGCTGRTSIVATRANASGAGQITRPIFEKGIKGAVDMVLPEDATLMASTANSGKAIAAVSPRSALARGLRDLSRRVVNADASVKPKENSFFNSLVSGLKKPHTKG